MKFSEFTKVYDLMKGCEDENAFLDKCMEELDKVYPKKFLVNFYNNYNRNLKDMMKENGIKGYEFAELIGYSRISISNWNKGHRELKPELLRMFAYIMFSENEN